MQRQAGDEDIPVVSADGGEAVRAQRRQPPAVGVPVDGQVLERLPVGGGQAHVGVRLVRDDRRRVDRAVQQPGAERAFRLAAGVGHVVGVGPGLVLQACRESSVGGGELLVEAPYEEAFEREDRGDPHGQARHGEEDHHSGGQLRAEGARQGDPAKPSSHQYPGFRT